MFLKIWNKILILLLFFNFLFSIEYKKDFVNISAKIFPRIIIMDENYIDKLVDNKIIITIIFDPFDIDKAKYLRKKIIEEYGFTIMGKGIKIILSEVGELKTNLFENTTSIIILNIDNSLIEKISNINKNSKIIFSYSPEQIKYGGHVSIDFKNTLSPLLNKEAINKSKIKFDENLIGISEFYINKKEKNE